MNLRIIEIKATDSRTIQIRFTDTLNPSIGADNVLVTGIQPSTPDAEVLAAIVVGDVLKVTVLPMTPFVKYKVTCRSVTGTPFTSESGNGYLIEDGTENVREVLGSEDPNNTYRDELVAGLTGQPYNPERGTFIRYMFNEISNGFLRATRDIRQSKNDNYLSFYVTDEQKQRAYGPYDRLSEEGAFHVSRVGITPENQVIPGAIPYDYFTSDIITLQATEVSSERLNAGEGPSTFNRFILTTAQYPITKLTAVTIAYQSGDVYVYDIRSYGYQLQDSKYDTAFASTLLTLGENQIKLSEELLNDPDFKVPENGDEIRLSYEYKALGKIIDDESVSVSQVLDATREPTPALSNEFSLGNAPVVNGSNQIMSEGGVTFLDPNSDTPFKTTHPAFVKELPYDGGNAPPRNVGEYSIDYENGRVFVYGENYDHNGTGYFPPTATYKYRNEFVRDLDYTYRAETLELVASPLRDLVGQEASIYFNYEHTLVEGIDYKLGVHTEELSERIENRLLSANSLRVLNAPITNVFRIFNETSGEIYTINRFVNDKVVFSYTNPPNIDDATLERATFTPVLNEQLIVDTEFLNVLGTKIYKINLANQNIMSASEDVIGSSYNTSAYFSRSDIFETELYYEAQLITPADNYNKLNVNDYQIDYRSGILYVGVSNAQDLAIGTASYRKPVVSPNNSHVMAVSNVYYSINPAQGVSKYMNYTDFGEGFITPSEFDISDERFLNGDTSLPYLVNNGRITVQDDIKTVRNVFDNQDLLLNSGNALNFGPNATSDANVIILDSEGVESEQSNVVNAGLVVTVNLPSPGISLNNAKSVIRVSDQKELLDGYQVISGNDIILSPSSGANTGDAVSVIFSAALNNGATPIVDYDRGEYFIDYTYLADEIIVSYEWGDNVIDFRESTALSIGQEYYVNYRVGALRDSLLANFGSLITIPELNTFDVDLERERYRDALIGSLQSFTKGPTNPAMKDMVAEVTKIQPDIIESVFQHWSLGITPLFLGEYVLNCPKGESSQETVDRTIVPAKFDNGYLPTEQGDYIKFATSSNLRLEEGSMEMTVFPEWDGIDNDAMLTFSNLRRDGYVIDPSSIYIGSTSYNPTIKNGEFSVSRFDTPSPIGLPSAIFTEIGYFIFYNEDNKSWQVLAKDKSVDGYHDGYVYDGAIISSGDVYDVKPIPGVSNIDDVIRSADGRIDFSFKINNENDGYKPGDGYVPGYSFDGLTFMSDNRHYFFDMAGQEASNRLSLYKDGRGYLNFEVWDQGKSYLSPDRKNKYAVSADIQDWQVGEEHSIGISWKLDTKDSRDEMHLFVDGLEVPNIIRYGGVPRATSTDRFRTVKPELVVGMVPKNAVAGLCVTSQGSNEVQGVGVDFGMEGIVPGDIIEIQEINFSTYIITNVNGPTLTLDSPMPASLSDARFTVNPYSAIVSTEVDIYSNIAVYKLKDGVETEIPGLRATIPAYEILKNAFNQNVLKILGDVDAGSQVLIRTLGINFRKCKETVYLWSDQSILKTQMPTPINLDEVSIVSSIQPYVVLSPDNSSIVGGNFEKTLSPSEVSNVTEGRTLAIRIAGGNVDFNTPTTVTINGTSTGGGSEIVEFSEAGIKNTVNKWMTITSVEVVTKPITTLTSGAGIEILEAYPVTNPDGNTAYPVIRYSYQRQAGVSLEGAGGNIVTDPTNTFSVYDVGNSFVIESPASVAGTYIIEEKIDNYTLKLNASLPAFTEGKYQIYNVSLGRSGFQNGFFFLEEVGTVNTPYPLPKGYYKFNYSAYLEVPFDPVSGSNCYLGSDFNGNNQANAKIDEFRISNVEMTDTRVGETIGINQESMTTGASKISPFVKKPQTLVLFHLDEYPIVNDADYWTTAERSYVQSATSVNDKFEQSILINDKGLGFDNKGRLTTDSEGTIEFFVSPKYDTFNDPVPRVYFDGAASIAEEQISLTKGFVKTSDRIKEVLSIRLASDVSQTGTDYYAGGSLENDFQTIRLGTPLPYQQTPVIVTYLPSGATGDRITIFKDYAGYLSFRVVASGVVHEVRQPVFWSRDTWHRVKVTFKFNRKDNQDQMRLYVDGEERNSVRFGQGVYFGQGYVFGANSGLTSNVYTSNIDFKDLISRFYVGQDFVGSFGAHARIDNLRLSNKSLESPVIGGQAIDVNYNQIVECMFPVIENAYTTMLLDFDQIIEKIDDFAILRDSEFGIFNFTINVIDSFRIVERSDRVQAMLEAMIYALKPATSKVEINYVR